jgi:type IV pilus assembly protein PilQ
MRSRIALIPIGVFASVAALTGASTPIARGSARLLEIRSEAQRGKAALFIEASDPVAYVTSQPDPFTLFVDMRQVSATGAVNRVAQALVGPIGSVSVVEDRAPDGARRARVRVALREPVVPHVHSTRNTIVVEVDGESAMLAAPAPARAMPAATAAAARRATEKATVISALTATPTDDGVAIVLKGNGRLVPRRVQHLGQPDRILLDFDAVAGQVAPTTAVEQAPVRRVRVAANSTAPLVTRVVVDLDRASKYRLDDTSLTGDELTIFVGEHADLIPTAGVAPAAPAAEPAPMVDTPTSAPAPVLTVPSVSLDTVIASSATGLAAPILAKPVAARAVEVSAPVAKAPGRPELSATLEPVRTPTPVLQPTPAVGTAQQAPPAGAAALPSSQRKYTGHPVSLDFQGVDLRAVLRTFAEITGLNLVIDPGVQGAVDVALKEVPWDQALDIILRANQLGYIVDGTIVRIAPLASLADEEKDRRRLADEQALSGELRVVTRSLSYARAEDLAALITKSALSSRGSVQVDERTNTLIMTDLQVRLDTATELLNTLDRAQPQVEIEARIVQTSRDFARAIGVQWGFQGRMSPELGNTSALPFPNRGVLGGREGNIQGPSDAAVTAGELSSSAVNLRAPNATSAVGLALGAINGALNLDVALSALERNGKGRILSTPRVSTQNNVAAEIMQGIQIPIQTVSNNTITVSFKDAALQLRVTPQITASQTVIMKVELENASPDFSRSVNGIPPIDTQRALTQVLVNDGATTVIGGIFVSREQSVNDRTPVLHRLPLLGWMFKRDSVDEENRELLIFITPRIIKS